MRWWPRQTSRLFTIVNNAPRLAAQQIVSATKAGKPDKLSVIEVGRE